MVKRVDGIGWVLYENGKPTTKFPTKRNAEQMKRILERL